MGGWSDGAPRNGVVGRRPGGVCGWSDGRTPLDNICSQYFLSLHRTAVSLPGSAEGYVVGRVLARVGGRTRVQHACSSKISRRCAPRARRGRARPGQGGRTRGRPAGVGGWSDGTGTSSTGSTSANRPGPALFAQRKRYAISPLISHSITHKGTGKVSHMTRFGAPRDAARKNRACVATGVSFVCGSWSDDRPAA